jgi:DNA-binding winged helix-turn-helix (wHTH) protein/tetratricopeptide (TPR) repeat protein
MLMRDTRVFCFAPFRLDLGAERLWRGEESVQLTAKAFAVLRYLVEHAGPVVTKTELFDAVWALTAVSDAALTVCIGEIRRALQDTAQRPQFLETVRGRRYRFIVPVSLAAAAGVPATAFPPPLRLSPVSPPLLVGREAELARLLQCWEQARQGERQVVFITGEAGIGKTTLVDALVAPIVGSQVVWYGHGQCIEQHGAGEAYLPVLEALTQVCRGAQGAAVLEVLRHYAPTWLLQLPALLPVSDLETLPPRASGTSPQRMLRELAEAVEVLTATQPLVLVLEDLHWSDVSTLDWLAYVAQRRAPGRLLVVVTYRPVDALVQGHPLPRAVQELQRHGQAMEIRLTALAVTGVEAYLRHRFGDLPQHNDLAQVLHQRTAGHPFFLITVVDALLQQGMLRQTATGWELGGNLQAAVGEVPESVRQMIAQQVARCAPEVQAVLEAASVVGAEFAAAAVVAGINQASDVVEAGCDLLVRREQFLYALAPLEWPDGTLTARYRFRHELYREVLYERLPVSRRVRWHRQIGVRLETGYGPQAREIAAELAEHFIRGRDPERAVHYLQLAAEQAMARSAHREAVLRYEQALQAMQQLPQSPAIRAAAIDLHLAIHTALIPLGDSALISQHLQAAEALANHLEDVERQGQIAVYWTRALGITGHHDEAIAWGQRALTLLQDQVTLRMTTQLYLSYTYYYRGDYQAAMTMVHEALGTLGHLPSGARLGAALPEVSLHRSLTQCLSELGQFDAGIAHGHAAVQAAELAGHPFSLYQACRCLASLYLTQGVWEHAVPLFERARTICQEADLPYGLPYTVACLGLAYAQAAHPDAALACLEQGRHAVAAHRPESGHAMMLVLLGTGWVVLGDLTVARPLAHEALAVAQAREERGFAAYALHLLGLIAAREERPEVAVATRYYQHAMALAQALGMRPLLAHLHERMGALYSHLGQQAQAMVALSTAVGLYRTMAMTFWLPQAERRLARLLPMA